MNQTVPGQKAVIYCRVSSAKQTTRGDGLSSQETRCREFARYRGLEVVKVFKDDASGSAVTRPGMNAMLDYLRSKRKDHLVVIIDDISRLARGLTAHLQLRADIARAGGTLQSPSIEFGEDSDSVLVENLLASVSQHQRQKNGEQTLNRMRARALNGFWCFGAPWGYRYGRAQGGGKILMRDEPAAGIVTEALEGFASGRFASPAEVKRFLESRPEFTPCRHGVVLHERVNDLLTQPLYAGYLHIPRWDISLRKAQHEALIDFETYQAIQDRLTGKQKSPYSIAVQDFPLRGYLACGCCGHEMTACWSKGRHTRYPYYLCFQRGCPSYRKSIRRETIEGAFEEMLKSLAPSQDLVALAEAIFRDLWDGQIKAGEGQRAALQQEMARLHNAEKTLLDRLLDSDVGSAIAAYEKRLGEVEAKKHLISEKIAKCGRPLKDYDESFRTARDFLANPWNLWVSDKLEDKRAVIKLVFGGTLTWKRGEGFRTAEIALPFRVLDEISGDENEMAHRAR
jgi:DNA invertase Pin-like site-specific DNA recombinase